MSLPADMTPAEEAAYYRPNVLASCAKTRSGQRWERRRLRALQLVRAARSGDLEAVKKHAEKTDVLSWAAREAAANGFLQIMDYLHSLMEAPNAAVCGEAALSMLEPD